MRRVVLLAVMFAALEGLADAACPSGARCGRVTVALDHTGATPGTQSVAYALVPATGPRTGTIVFLAGGPGQAALPLTADVVELLAPLRASHDIVTVDQRGTGDSDPVECDSVEDCAQRLGVRRAFLSTTETAHDLEALRVALAADKLTLFGVSYGTKVAAEYARRYPDRTAALVLDSPVPVDGLDSFGQLRIMAAPRVLREVCTPGLCRRTVSDPGDTLDDAVARVRRGAVRGPLVRPSGRVDGLAVTESLVLALLVASDTSPGLRAGLPAALKSLAEGDAAPLLHLTQITRSGTDDIDEARLLATLCTETRLPWSPESAVATRQAALDAFLAERGAAFAPFSPAALVEDSTADLCLRWPPTPRPETVALAGPDVPVLILSGRDDLRTPLEDARRTAAQYPNARLLAVPGVGHSVLRTDPAGCARAGVVAFLRGRTVSACAPAGLPAAPYAPATVGALPPTRLPGVAGRTLSALTVTLTGIAFDVAAHGRRTFRLPGLRSGYVRGTRRALRLHDVEWLRGVFVSGRLDSRGRGTLSVNGPASGSVTYTGRGASGTLGGRSFTL
jgi:pimeloyl-ACP methyl ester carboxylesterase